MVDLVDNVVLNVLRNGPFPKLDIFPNIFVLDQFEKIMLFRCLLRLIHLEIKSGGKHLTVDRDTGVNRVIIFVQNYTEEFT